MPITLHKITRLSVLLAVFLIPFYFFRIKDPVPTNPFEIMAFLALLLTLVNNFYERKRLALGLGWTVVFLLLILFYTQLEGDYTAWGIFKGWFLAPFALYLAIINNFSHLDNKKLLFPLLTSTLLIVVWALWQKFGLIDVLFYQVGDGTFTQYLEQGRIFGPFESPNYLAMFLVPAGILSLAALNFHSKNKKRLLAASLLFILPVLIYSDSRAGLLALGGALAIYLLVNAIISKSLRVKGLYLGLLILIMLGGFLFAQDKINLASGSNMVRQEIYNYAFLMIEQKPVAGIGVANFHDEITALSKGNSAFIAYGLPYAIHPHNVFLAFWLNFGLFGLLGFVTLLAFFVYNLWRSRKNGLTALTAAAMAAILIHGLFDTTYFKNDLSALFWLILALSVMNRKEDR